MTVTDNGTHDPRYGRMGGMTPEKAEQHGERVGQHYVHLTKTFEEVQQEFSAASRTSYSAQRALEGDYERDYRRASEAARKATVELPTLFPAGDGHYSVESIIDTLTFHIIHLRDARDAYENGLADMLQRAEARGRAKAHAERVKE